MVTGGLGEYFSNMWNVMDWLNYAIFYLAYLSINSFLAQARCGPLAAS